MDGDDWISTEVAASLRCILQHGRFMSQTKVAWLRRNLRAAFEAMAAMGVRVVYCDGGRGEP